MPATQERRSGKLSTVVNRHAEPRACWAMTGTPTPNNPTDAWAQCRLVAPDNVPPYVGRFKNQVMKQVTQFQWLPRPEATDIVRRVMQPSVRFTRDECLDLPPVMFETRSVQLTTEQNKAYKDMAVKLRTERRRRNYSS